MDKTLEEKAGEALKVLRAETDRGLIIVGAAYHDDALRSLLSARLVETSDKEDRLLAQERPVSSFAARIELAFRVGCIGESLRESLHIERSLRNRFAHAARKATFEESSVKDRVENLFRQHTDFIGYLLPEIERELEARGVGKVESRHPSDPVLDSLYKFGPKFLYTLWAASIYGALASRVSEIARIEFDSL